MSGWRLREVLVGVLACALLLVLAPAVVAAPVRAPAATATALDPPLMLVVDVSGSMGEQDARGTTKIEGAKTGILELLNLLSTDSRIGLRTYPSRGADCGPGRLAIAIEKRDPASMSASIRALRADGGTPTAEALRAAGADLRAKGYSSATIILVSDGESTCDPPCPVARELATQGLHVVVRAVGFLVDTAGAEEMRCLADATGGSYTDVSDAKGLAAQLTSLGGASLDVDVSAPLAYSPTTQTSLEVTATIENDADVPAEDVRATLTFDPAASGGALVTAPVRVLGNAAARGSLAVSWTALPSRAVDTGSLAFTVVVTSRGLEPVVTTGAVRIQNRLTREQLLADAGEILASTKHVVVLGDSYSSGEGARHYDETAGGCHRSRHTYARQIWAEGQVTNLACSGAVVLDHTRNQPGRAMDGRPWPTQQSQLAGAMERDPDLVLLTMGGNDVDFANIVVNCGLGLGCGGEWSVGVCSTLPRGYRQLCTSRVTGPALAAGPTMWTEQLGALRTTLRTYYERLLSEVGDARVIVLPYVEVVPSTTRGALGCVGALPAFGTHEFELVRWLQAELNNQIAAAVRDVRAKNHEDQLFFAGDVATALQPDHTLCADQDQRWVQGLLARVETQEKVHPTAVGYQAIAAALVRWSATMDPPSVTPSTPQPRGWLTRAGRAVADGVDATVDWIGDRFREVGEAVLNAPNLRLLTGRPVTVRAQGFGPGQSVVLGVGSTLQTLAVVTADDDGAVAATVELPEDLHPGDHIVFAAGHDHDGHYRVEWAPAEVANSGTIGPLSLTLLGLGFVLAGRLLLRRTRASQGGAG